MTPRNRALLYAPPILGLVVALGWAVVDRVLDSLGVKAAD